MLPLFARYGVRNLALSSDPVPVVEYMKRKRGYSFTLLADPDREVIRQFGLENPGALRYKTVEILGLPLGIHTGREPLVIPTSILVDEAGIVRWIDRTDDYRMRGGRKTIETALADSFGEPEGMPAAA